jgi:hypothetical protein
VIAPDNDIAQLSSQITALERQIKILKAERASQILHLRRAGASLGAIGKASGLTRQRVLQIVQSYEATNAAP